ncbi:hypothetical protein Q3G72_009335 [Acer saccharum]|nr:hypothetical protein Q3G72_009335 [Acer saccharum]
MDEEDRAQACDSLYAACKSGKININKAINFFDYMIHMQPTPSVSSFNDLFTTLHWKASYKDKILPATHPDSVHVMLILKEIIEALQRGLSLENVGRVRKKGQEKWLQATTSHLEGFNWEVMVVNEPDMETFFIPGGLWCVLMRS